MILVLGLPIYQFEIKIPSLAFIEIEVKDVSFGDLGIFSCPITMIKEKGKVKSEYIQLWPFTYIHSSFHEVK